MKRREFLALGSTGLLAACAGHNINLEMPGNKELALYTVETIAIPIGYYAGQHTAVDLALRTIYDLAVNGTLTVVAVNRILETLGAQDPMAVLMVRRVVRLGELAGAAIEGGRIVDLAGLDPDYIDAAARGYVEGYDTYRIMA